MGKGFNNITNRAIPIILVLAGILLAISYIKAYVDSPFDELLATMEQEGQPRDSRYDAPLVGRVIVNRLELRAMDDMPVTFYGYASFIVHLDARYNPDGSMVHGGLYQLRERVPDSRNLQGLLESDVKEVMGLMASRMSRDDIMHGSVMNKSQEIIRNLNYGWRVVSKEPGNTTQNGGWIYDGIEFTNLIISLEETPPETKVYDE